MIMKATKKEKRTLRHTRVRSRVSGLKERPRVAVFRSLSHIYAQVIDDSEGRTLMTASDRELPESSRREKTKKEIAFLVGEALGKKARSAGITKVVFDRAGFSYHGRVASLAEGLRGTGVEF
jgi:large subunit ribosomal protein L18